MDNSTAMSSEIDNETLLKMFSEGAWNPQMNERTQISELLTFLSHKNSHQHVNCFHEDNNKCFSVEKVASTCYGWEVFSPVQGTKYEAKLIWDSFPVWTQVLEEEKPRKSWIYLVLVGESHLCLVPEKMLTVNNWLFFLVFYTEDTNDRTRPFSRRQKIISPL
jgi:hypothetical protein